MKKVKVLIVRIAQEQDKILEAKANSAGFIKKSDYVRLSCSCLCLSMI